MSSPFHRSLPARPDLAQQKTQARELLRAFAAGHAEAVARVRDALPDKARIALADAQFTIAREYGFESWPALRRHVDAARAEAPLSPGELHARVHAAFQRRDAVALRALFARHAELRAMVNAPVFAFDAPAIVAYAADADVVDVLLEHGADPNARSAWWAGGFHALHSATPESAARLMAAGAVPDACAAAHLDRVDLLGRMLADDPARARERGGDGQTPLHFARSRAAVDLLLAAGADLDARDVDHRATPAEWMLERRAGVGRWALAHYLVERGAAADVFLAAALGLTDRAAALVREDPARLDLRTGRGEYGERTPSSFHIYFWTIGGGLSPLDAAAQFGQAETLAALLALATPLQRLQFEAGRGDAAAARLAVREHGALLAGMGPEGHRALADAAWRGDAAAVALMVELGFDPRATGHDGGSALHCAAWAGSAESVAALLGHPDAASLLALRDGRYGATPLGWCCHGSVNGDRTRDHAGVARRLLDAGAAIGPDTAGGSPAVAAVLAARAPGASR